jgi:hypothetical protein
MRLESSVDIGLGASWGLRLTVLAQPTSIRKTVVANAEVPNRSRIFIFSFLWVGILKREMIGMKALPGRS